MMATRFQARRRARCSVRNSDSRGSGKRRKRKPLSSRRAASERFGDEVVVGAMLREPATALPAVRTALYVFGGCEATAARTSQIELGLVRSTVTGTRTRVRHTSKGLHACLRSTAMSLFDPFGERSEEHTSELQS